MFNALFYRPVYNVLMAIGSVSPNHDMGVAIIALTIIIRGLLAPLSHTMLVTQKRLREVEPRINAIRDKHKNNPEEQGKQIMAIYKEHGINPFSGFALFAIQIPLFFALYKVARDNFASAAAVAYSFVTPPDSLATMFLGVYDLSKPYVALAIIAGVTFFVQAWLANPPVPKKTTGKEDTSFMADFSRTMSLQTRYVLPIFIAFISLKLSAAVVLYIITSNMFSVVHELYVRWTAKKLTAAI